MALKEYRIILLKEQYMMLVKKFIFDSNEILINFFYKNDAENCNNLCTSVEVKVIKDKIYLYVKEYSNIISTTYKEYKKELCSIPYVITAENLNNLCHSREYKDSYLIGLMVTTRKKINIEGYEVALDINKYCEIIDYELIVKYKNELNFGLINMLTENGVYGNQKGDNKYKRFLKKIE